MRNIHNIFILWLTIILLLGCATGQKNRNVHQDSLEHVYSPEELRTDLEYLWETLHEVHPDLYALTNRDSLHTKFKRLYSDLSEPMTRSEYFLKAAPLIASINDGHTFLSVPITARRIVENELVIFPFDLAFIEDTTYIMQDYSRYRSPFIGAQLIAIDGVPIEKIREDFIHIMNRETYSFTLQSLESDIFKILLWMKNPYQSTWEITYRLDDSNEIKTNTLIGMSGSDLVRTRVRLNEQSSSIFSLYFYENERTAVLQLRTFQDIRTKSFYRTAFKEINNNNIENLVIDLRGNLGGYTSYVDELLSYLIDEPILPMPKIQIKLSQQLKERNKPALPRWLSWLHPKDSWRNTYQEYWEQPDGKILNLYVNQPIEPKPRHRRFHGDLYVLTNGHSFSTGAHFPSIVREYGLGQILGNETGGLFGGSFGEHIMVELPQTGIPVGISTSILKHKEIPDFKSHGVIPDYYIHRDIDREIIGIDSQLERTLQFISSSEE